MVEVLGMTLHIELLEQKDQRLGRHVVHDSRSRDFAFTPPSGGVDKSTWKSVAHRLVDPKPKPNQTVGNCTMCAEAMLLNAVGNRKAGEVLDMNWALDGYVWETHNDNFPGAWNRDGSGQDTGSSGLWAAKTAQHFGKGGVYSFSFNGADEVVQGIVDGHVFSVGTRWDKGMFTPDANGVIHPGGPVAGGHQWVARRFNFKRDLVGVDCWWGGWSAWIARGDLDGLLADQGDAYIQARA